MTHVTTMVFDNAISQPMPRFADSKPNASSHAPPFTQFEVHTNPVLTQIGSGPCTIAYDPGSPKEFCAGIQGRVTTLAYINLDPNASGISSRHQAMSSDGNRGEAIESRLVSKLMDLLQNPPDGTAPLWRRVWQTVVEDPWLSDQQAAIGRRLVRRNCQWHWIEEMIQESSLHLGRVFQHHPTLGLSLDELPTKFGRWLRQIIREDFIAWLRLRLKREERNAGFVDEGFVQPTTLCLADKLDLMAALAELPVLHQNVVRLRMARFRREEIAQHLNLSEYQVGRIIRQSNRRLRRLLRAFEPD